MYDTVKFTQEFLSSVEEYKLGKSSTTWLSSLNVARYLLGCSHFTNQQGVSSVIVAGGGYAIRPLQYVKVTSVEQMTRSETGVWSSWATIGNLPAGRWGMGMISVDNSLYIVGGRTHNSDYEDSILKSVDGKEWEETDYKLKIGRFGHHVISTDYLCQ